jgi:ribose/xylose/arabinose/galactoside ABC-type transport system permease subunit
MKLRISPQQLPLISTAIVFAILYICGCFAYHYFFSANVFLGFLQDNCFLGIAAVGATFVILSGGIDLSVGAVIGCTTIGLASLIEHAHLHPALAIVLVLLATTLIGGGMGAFIHIFSIPSFLITLAGLFFYRGLALLISTEQIDIDSSPFHALSDFSFHIAKGVSIRPPLLILLATIWAGIFLTRRTAFGRSIYAIGGAENSALLMGLPVARNKILTYALSGFCSGLAGVTAALYFNAGYALHASGLELDAIAVVVVGGTLLTGGFGSVVGTFLGILIFGIIQAIINFQNLNSWWTRIAVGGLLLAFILLQKLIRWATRRSAKTAANKKPLPAINAAG